MPNITLTWSTTLYVPTAVQYGVNNWIFTVKWRRGDNTQLPEGARLYIIQNSDGHPIYAGQADDARSRFNARADALRQLGIAQNADALSHRVDIASINPAARINLAEQWLVRILYLRDHTAPPYLLQNVNLTNPFDAPDDGLTVTNNNRPGYLNANYDYMGGEQI